MYIYDFWVGNPLTHSGVDDRAKSSTAVLQLNHILLTLSDNVPGSETAGTSHTLEESGPMSCASAGRQACWVLVTDGGCVLTACPQ